MFIKITKRTNVTNVTNVTKLTNVLEINRKSQHGKKTLHVSKMTNPFFLAGNTGKLWELCEAIFRPTCGE